MRWLPHGPVRNQGALYNVEINLSSIRTGIKEMVQEKEAILKSLQLQEELKETVENRLS